MRKTKIIATVGPACQSKPVLKSMIRAGADMLRINASHTTPQSLAKWVRRIRSFSETIPILVDLQGPRVRTGLLEAGMPLRLVKGQRITIKISTRQGSRNVITTPVRQFSSMVSKGDSILLDNGYMELRVLRKNAKQVSCRVLSGGILGENKGINLPNAPTTLPALTSKDRKDLAVASRLNVDYIALSFVRSAQDIHVIKGWMKRHHKEIPIIAKIEKPAAVFDIENILKKADGIMVARGDLGIEMGVEKIPAVQKSLIKESNRMKIPVVTATEMLESMIHRTRPTRAEASDVANAVFDETDAVMLSGETAVGKHPVSAVKTMAKIIREAENHPGEFHVDIRLIEALKREELPIHAITHASRHAARDLKAKAILVFTHGGKTAMLISKFRPQCPVIALTSSEGISRRLSLCKGVHVLKVEYQRNTDAMIREGEKAVVRAKMLKRGDAVVIVSGRQALPAARYMTKIHFIGERKR